MNATKTRQPRQRKIGVVERHGRHSLLEMQLDGRPEYYLAEELLPDFGTAAYRLEKYDGTTYDVLLDERTGHHTCECRDFLHRSRRHGCKHIVGLLALRNAGKLPSSFAKPSASLVELDRPFRPGRDDEPTGRPTHCGCRCAEEHQALCLDPWEQATR